MESGNVNDILKSVNETLGIEREVDAQNVDNALRSVSETLGIEREVEIPITRESGNILHIHATSDGTDIKISGAPVGTTNTTIKQAEKKLEYSISDLATDLLGEDNAENEARILGVLNKGREEKNLLTKESELNGILKPYASRLGKLEGMVRGEKFANLGNQIKELKKNKPEGYQDQITALKKEQDEISKASKYFNDLHVGGDEHFDFANSSSSSFAYSNKLTDIKYELNSYLTNNEDLEFLKSDKIKSVYEKIENGEDLTEREIKTFSKAQKIYNNVEKKYDSVFDEVVTREGFEAKQENKTDRYKYHQAARINDIKEYNSKLGEYEVVDGELRFVDQANDVTLKDANSEKLSRSLKGLQGEEEIAEILSGSRDTMEDSYAKLYDLNEKGVDIGSDGKEILNRKAAAIKGNIGDTDKGVTALNKYANVYADKFDISSENIQYIDKAEGFSIDKNYSVNKYDGKFKFNMSDTTKASLDEEQLKEFTNKNGNLKNIANQELSDLDTTLIQKATEDKLTNKYGVDSFDEVKNKINNVVSEMVDETENNAYGLSKAEQIKKSFGSNLSDKEIASVMSGNVTHDIANKIELENGAIKKFSGNAALGKFTKDDLNKILDNNEGWVKDLGIEVVDGKPQVTDEVFSTIGEKLEAKRKMYASGMGYKLERTLDPTKRDEAIGLYNNIFGGDTIKGEKLAEAFEVSNTEKKVSIGELINISKKENVDEAIRANKEKILKDSTVKFLKEAVDSGNLKEEEKKQFKKGISKFNDNDFTDVEKGIFSETAEKIGKAKGPKRIETGGMDLSMSGIGKALKGKTGLALAAAAVGMGVIGIASAVHNASEERERKRQELDRMAMAQQQSIKGSY